MSLIKFTIPPKINFNICEESLFAFEYFTFRDPEMVAEMKTFLRLASDKFCLLDIGALFGTFSLAFTCHSSKKKAFSIEPSPEPFRILNTNIKINPKLNVDSYQLALGSKNGKLKMYYEWLHLVALAKGSHAKEFVEVKVFKLDDFLKKENIVPDVIKIDVEGSEFDVLKGGRAFLKKHKPLIFLETHTPWLNNLGISTHKLVGLIHFLGYKIYDLECNLIESPKVFLDARANCRVILSAASL